MGRRLLFVILIIGLSGITVRAQNVFVGAGSTAQGDYLRGAGIAAWGMGLFNYNTAVANSINLDTFIRGNEYLAAVEKQRLRDYVAKKETDRGQTKGVL